MICENCGQPHDGTYASGRFCCKSCAHSFSTKSDKNKTKYAKCIKCKRTYIIAKRAPSKTFICDNCKGINKCKFQNDYCENVKNCCLYKLNICNKNKKSYIQKINSLIKYNIINKNSIGDNDKMYYDILQSKNKIINLFKKGFSSVEICEQLFGSSKHGNTICKTLNITGRNLSEAVSNAYLTGRMKYNSAWYKTWNNKEVFLRSSYEVDYAKELDKRQIDYEVESLRIKYVNSKDNKEHCAVPDFYLKDSNTIVEIKSDWTLDIQEMKDKVKAYKEQGYNFKLILNHNEVDLFKL